MWVEYSENTMKDLKKYLEENEVEIHVSDPESYTPSNEDLMEAANKLRDGIDEFLLHGLEYNRTLFKKMKSRKNSNYALYDTLNLSNETILDYLTVDQAANILLGIAEQIFDEKTLKQVRKFVDEI